MVTTARPAAEQQGPEDVRARLWQDGEVWTIAAGDTIVRLRDGKGLRHLAALAATPHVEHQAVELAATSRCAGSLLAPTVALRMRELDEELEEAEALLDLSRAALLRREIASLEHDPAPPAGDADALAAAAERARLNVTRALRATVRRIAGRAPLLGTRLELSLKTGAQCAFHPAPGFELLVGPPPAGDPAPPRPKAPPAPAGRATRTLALIELCASMETAARLGEERWRAALARHDAAIRAQAGLHGGHAGMRAGDRTLVVLDGAAAAVACAEGALAAAADDGLLARAGVHAGEIEQLGASVFGPAVHATGGLASLAAPGEVLVSGAVAAELPAGTFALTDAGPQELPGVPGRVAAFALAVAPAQPGPPRA